MAQAVATGSALSAFAQKILSGEEGVFFSERSLHGDEHWVFGTGKKITADFEAGPFPFFSVTSFLADSHFFWHFPAFFTSETGLPDEFSNAEMKLSIGLDLPSSVADLASFSHETEKLFCEKVEKIKQAAQDGEVWVCNLTHDLSGNFPFKTEKESAAFLVSAFSRFLESEKPHVGGIIWTHELKLVSFSPEVFLRQEGNILSTFPIKGTGKRDDLENSEKEKEELAMVTDLLRNDLGQIVQRVNVLSDRVMTDQADFFHTHAEISAELPSDTLRWEDFRKLLPCGSISGAPKKRVIEKILELESFDRKFYTGTFGVKLDVQHGIWNILIRTLFLDFGKWHYPVGAGLTHRSDSGAEWQETLAKAGDLLQFCRR